MAPHLVIVCAQCGSVVDTEPVGLGDELFCCLGCVGGGACICEQQGHDTLALRVGPFTSQAELLRFAARLEQSPGLLQVEMTDPDLQEARFTAVAPSPDVLALAVEANPDFTITVETSGSTVYGRVARPRRSRASSTADGLLPTRTRFRVFRAASETTAEGASSGAREPARSDGDPTEEQVAELLANARATASMRAFAPQPIVSVRTPADAPEAQPPSLGAAPMTVAIVGSGFPSFLALNEFQGVVRALPGVRDTRVRRFYAGTLNLAVDYEDGVPFVERLRLAAGSAWTVTASTPERVEVRVTSVSALVSNG
ncbi:MAG: hypothetical protein WCI61_10380 [Chloroflexota bacterium]